MKQKWSTISIDEQETIINVDYYEKYITLYTTKKSTYNRIKKALGEADMFDRQKGLICGAEWKISFNNRKAIKKLLSITSLIPQKYYRNS